ncbi:MAG TPA: phospholipase D-like domain-containing protein [Burkholderiales bacterium]|nr:phospholipase D-like domain-containing protein [Burkholderiales bacterium]
MHPQDLNLRVQLRDDQGTSAALAERAFARATDAVAIGGNKVRILRDAAENYPAWLTAIRAAQRSIFLECYIISDDRIGNEFVDALCERAREGVRVWVIYDWLGSFSAGALWKRLREAGAQVRGFNPPRFEEPFGWITRDHRKMLAVDGHLGFVTGLCIADQWLGNPARKIEPWRDTGIEIRGPAVLELEASFGQAWNAAGPALEMSAFTPGPISIAGDVALRVVAGTPTSAGLYRLDHLISAMARERLWLTDAYFVGVTPYVRALCAAAYDNVDVRLMVPGASDLPIVNRMSRAGYRPLLEAGVRVFEWNGSMLHAKTAVADGRWARVGSTNLNIASWIGNYELDVAIEDEGIAQEMERMFEADLSNATEIVLGRRNRVTATTSSHGKRALSGSAGRAAAGALTMGSAFGAALSHKRVLEPAEAATLAAVALLVCLIAFVALAWPRALAVPIFLFCAWIGLAMLWRAFRLYRKGKSGAGQGASPE